PAPLPASCAFLIERPEASLQMHQQDRYGGRGYPRNARRLADGFGPVPVELLLHFCRQTLYFTVIERRGQGARFHRRAPLNLVALALDIAFIFRLDFDLLGNRRVRDGV